MKPGSEMRFEFGSELQLSENFILLSPIHWIKTEQKTAVLIFL